MIKKNKCCKDVVVVVIDTSTPYGGTFCDFLKELNPEKRCKYNYIPFYANTSNEAWVNKLKCKLKQLYKKKCKKPIVLSTLFDTNLEMLLARVQESVRWFWLTHSTYEVNSCFSYFQTLPAGELEIRTNSIYKNDGRFKRMMVGFLFEKNGKNGARPIAMFDKPYNNSLLAEMADQPIQGVGSDDINPNADNHDVFIADATGLTKDDFYHLAKPETKINEAPTISDKVLAQALAREVRYGNIKMVDNVIGLRIDGNSGPRYLNVYLPANYEEDHYPRQFQVMLDYAGAVNFNCPPNDQNCFTFELNQTKSAGRVFMLLGDHGVGVGEVHN